MENYNVDDSRKPDEDWQELSTEVRSLSCRCEEISDRPQEEWKLALLIYYMHHRNKPCPPLKLLDLETYERCWYESKLADYIVMAEELRSYYSGSYRTIGS